MYKHSEGASGDLKDESRHSWHHIDMICEEYPEFRRSDRAAHQRMLDEPACLKWSLRQAVSRSYCNTVTLELHLDGMIIDVTPGLGPKLAQT